MNLHSTAIHRFGRALAATALAALTAISSGAVRLDWTRSRDFAQGQDGPLIVTSDADGNVFVIGATPLFSGSEDVFVIKYDAAGAEQWTALYDGPASTYDYPAGAVVDAAGDVYVTAQSAAVGPIDTEWATFKLSGDDGAILWERRYHGSGTFGQSLPRDMALGPNGEIVVAGWARDDNAWLDFGVAVYDADGTELWTRQFSSPGFEPDSGEAVAVGPDGSVAVTGQYALPDNRVVATVLYDRNGVEQWSAIHDASAQFGMEDNARSVAIDADGNVYVAADGVDNFDDGRDFVLLKYDAVGELQWERRFVRTTSEFRPIVRLSPDGTIYVSGHSDAGHRIIAYAPDGTQLWTKRHTGSLTTESSPDHIVIDAHGYVALLLRTSYEPGISAFTVMRYAPNGWLADEISLDPEGVTRWTTGLAADAAGHLYATGWFSPDGHRDALLYKLSIRGSRGDVNCDGALDAFDIEPFILALTDPNGYAAQYPDCDIRNADINGDGVVDAFDIEPFVDSLVGP